MIISTKKIKTIDSYIASYPKDVADKLRLVRATIKKVAPQAIEAISYGIPTFKLNGNLIHFAAFKNHIGLYPGAAGVQAFKKEIVLYTTSKGAIQFPLDEPLPLPLIKKITKYRVEASLAKKKTGTPKKSEKNYVHYHKDGSIWAKGKITNGKMDGYWEWFRKDGTKMRSGYFNKGVQIGEWTTYDKKGKVVKVTQFTTKKLKTCSRGHEFQKSSDQPVCPKCWPGYYKKRSKDKIASKS